MGPHIFILSCGGISLPHWASYRDKIVRTQYSYQAKESSIEALEKIEHIRK